MKNNQLWAATFLPRPDSLRGQFCGPKIGHLPANKDHFLQPNTTKHFQQHFELLIVIYGCMLWLVSWMGLKIPRG